MCGRIVYVWDPKTKELVKKLVDDWDQDDEVVGVLQKRRYNVPPASHLPVVSGPDGARSIEVARWGFPIPQRPNGVFNTRMDRAFESAMWSTLIGKSHCLFPVKGFYEWRRDGKRKTPYFIHRADGETMLLAGLIGWRTWKDETLRCASVLTCEPNDLMAKVHDRMPVIIETGDAPDWLAAGDVMARRLAVPAGDVLAMHQVSDDVNSTDNDRPDLPEPIGQATLGGF